MTARQSRWWQEIMEYDIKLEHVPGAKLVQADALSRRPDHVREEEAKAKAVPQTMITPEMIIKSINLSWADQIQSLTKTDDFALLIINGLKLRKLPVRSKFTEWTYEDGILRYQGKTYIPANDDLRHEIIKFHHNLPIMGHPGHQKTLELIK